jgi:hypothetical protein
LAEPGLVFILAHRPHPDEDFLQSAPISRRHFLALSLFALPGFARWPHALVQPCEHGPAPAPRDRHPTPRPGITAANVLKEDELKDARDAVEAFNEVRQIPEIVDGIRCYCGCADNEGYYSLLSCYERPSGMAKMCDKCQGQGRYAFRLHRSGKSLDEIRAAIDARYS